MNAQRFALAGLLCVLSSGCAPQIHVVQEFRATFICENNQTLQVQFTAGQALLSFQDESATLIQQAGDGASQDTDTFLYRGDGQSLRQHGESVDWTDGKGTVHHCQRDMSPSPKSDAASH